MGPQTKEIGGGSATGLADSFIASLQKLMNTGGTGTAGSPDPMGSTGGIMGVLGDLLSPGAGKVGGSFADLIGKQQERDVAGLRARFGAGGGGAYGTPGASAESLYRSEAAPQIATQIGGLQLQALMPLLQAITGLSGKGIAQRELVQTPGAAGQVAGLLGAGAKAAAPFFDGGFGNTSNFGGNVNTSGFSKFLQGGGLQFGNPLKF